jgi:hypothetical protein
MLALLSTPELVASLSGQARRDWPDRQVHAAVMSPIISLSPAISHRLVPDQILYHSNDTQIGSCVTGDRNA